MSGYADHVERLNRELDEQLASGAKRPEALAIVAEQERRVAQASRFVSTHTHTSTKESN